MPRLAPELSDAQVRRLKWATVQSGPRKGKPRVVLHAVGGVGGLYLQCCPPAAGNKTFARSWILKTPIGNHRPELGLGPYPEVSLSSAREKARQLKDMIRQGIDPRAHRRAERSQLLREQAKAVTFLELGKRYHQKKAKEYKTAKQSKKLQSHLATYVYPHLGHLIVADIDRAHIVKMLTPIWESKTETATRIRAMVENILDMAGAEGLRTGDNPARWKGNLELSLAAPRKLAKVKHFSAMAVDDVPAFMAELAKKKTTGARALRFSILTASRSGETRGATWDEVDLEARTWTIPADRMKNGRQHRVPLGEDAVELLKKTPRTSSLVFTAPRGGPLSDMTLTKVLKDMGHQVTQHGFRATFRTWAQEHTNYAEEVCELALAHVNSDRTRAAYARSELIEKRRLLMADWEKFCREGLPEPSSLTPMRRRA